MNSSKKCKNACMSRLVSPCFKCLVLCVLLRHLSLHAQRPQKRGPCRIDPETPVCYCCPALACTTQCLPATHRQRKSTIHLFYFIFSLFLFFSQFMSLFVNDSWITIKMKNGMLQWRPSVLFYMTSENSSISEPVHTQK